MKTWLAKFRISTVLDSGISARVKSPPAQSESEEITRWEKSMQSLDRKLKAAQPTKPVPAVLHASVMRAVRAAAKSQERQSALWILRWLPAPALALLVVIGLLWSLSQSPQKPPSLAVAAIALEQSHDIAQKTPDVVLAPLAQEMNNLNRDFQNAVAFLAASVP